MSLSEQARYDQSGNWAESDPKQCACRGHGWMLSDLDFYAECPIHRLGAPHPEDDGEKSEFDWKAHRRQVLRNFLLQLQSDTVFTGVMTAGAFRRAVEAKSPKTPEDWCEAGRLVFNDAVDKLSEKLRYEREFPPHEDADGLDEDEGVAERAAEDRALRDAEDRAVYYSQFDSEF